MFNEPDEDGRTVLHLAAAIGNVEIPSILLQIEASPALATDDGRSVRQVVIDYAGHDHPILELLL
jgi:ankyrin repeat protein